MLGFLFNAGLGLGKNFGVLGVWGFTPNLGGKGAFNASISKVWVCRPFKRVYQN
jgi:hypothetical protein